MGGNDMTTIEIQAAIIAKQDEVINVCKQQRNILAGNENSNVIEFIGLNKLECKLNDEITDLKQQLETTVVAEIKSTAMPSGWICPRCQKVHIWMDMTCCCEPKTITSTTIRAADSNCNNCKNWHKSGNESPCNICSYFDKWEPIKTE